MISPHLDEGALHQFNSDNGQEEDDASRASPLTSAPRDDSTFAGADIAVESWFSLHGVTPVQDSIHRYELDFGEYVQPTSARIALNITLERMVDFDDGEAIHFVVLHIGAQKSHHWLKLSQRTGTIEKGKDYVGIEIEVDNTVESMFGVYHAYLLVQNTCNPRNLMLINVSIEFFGIRGRCAAARSGAALRIAYCAFAPPRSGPACVSARIQCRASAGDKDAAKAPATARAPA